MTIGTLTTPERGRAAYTPATPVPAAAGIQGAQAKATPESTQAKIEQAAHEFEALFVGQMLKSARESSAGTFTVDSSASTAMDLADEQLARALSEGGGLGLARTIIDKLQPGGTPVVGLGIPTAPSSRPSAMGSASTTL